MVSSRKYLVFTIFALVIGFWAGLGLTAQTAEGRFLRLWLNQACRIQTGSGSPESSVTGVVCDLFLRTNGGAASTLYVKESGTGNTGWVALEGTSSTATLTNKTLDAEGTGNVITIPFTREFPTVRCNTGGPTTDEVSSFSLLTPGTTSPAVACLSGTNGPIGVLRFEDDATQHAFAHFNLPSDWVGQVDLHFTWNTSATSGNVRFLFATACVADNESVDPSWNSDQEIVDAAKGVASRHNVATLSSVTMTGCAAGEMLKFRLGRDPAHASDTITADADVYGFRLTYRRAL